MDRKINFGKYKGTPIILLMLEHIGYVMWCLDNLKWFHLDKREQEIYDAVVIAAKNSSIQFVFSKRDLYRHVANRVAFNNNITPLATQANGMIGVISGCINHPIVQAIMPYITNNSSSNEQPKCDLRALEAISRVMGKDAEYAELEGYNDEEIYGGWADEAYGW